MVDDAVYAQAGVRYVTTDRAGYGRSARHRGRSVAGDDLLALTRPWGFDLAAVRVPVLLTYGDADATLPVAHGRLLARTLPTATCSSCPAGATSPTTRAPRCWRRTGGCVAAATRSTRAPAWPDRDRRVLSGSGGRPYAAAP